MVISSKNVYASAYQLQQNNNVVKMSFIMHVLNRSKCKLNRIIYNNYIYYS